MSYDPSTGRFISEDPIAFSGGDANLYRYTGNDPANLVDPGGLQDTMSNRPRKPRESPPGSPGNPLPLPGNTLISGPGGNAPSVTPGNTAIFPSPLLPGQIVGVTGADPCVGLIMVPPPGSGRPYVTYHFTTGFNDWYNIMNQYADLGYDIIITGGGTQNDMTTTGNAIADFVIGGDYHTGKRNLERACNAGRKMHQNTGNAPPKVVPGYRGVGIDGGGAIYIQD